MIKGVSVMPVVTITDLDHLSCWVASAEPTASAIWFESDRSLSQIRGTYAPEGRPPSENKLKSTPEAMHLRRLETLKNQYIKRGLITGAGQRRSKEEGCDNVFQHFIQRTAKVCV